MTRLRVVGSEKEDKAEAEALQANIERMKGAKAYLLLCVTDTTTELHWHGSPLQLAAEGEEMCRDLKRELLGF